MMRAGAIKGLQPINGEQDLPQQAVQLDRTIRQKVKTLHRDCAELGGLLAKMRDLWRYLPGKKFRSFEAYATNALGESMSRSRVYELITAHLLTEGPHGIAAGTVARMGIEKGIGACPRGAVGTHARARAHGSGAVFAHGQEGGAGEG